MPAAQSRIVRECHRYSAQADAIAASASDEQTKAAFLEIAKRWLDIALTYEFRGTIHPPPQETLAGLTKPRLRLARHENAPPQVTHE